MAPRDSLPVILDLWIETGRALTKVIAAAEQPRFGAETSSLLIVTAVLLSTLQGRPMSSGKLSAFVGIPRPSVIRRLQQLASAGLVEIVDGRYRTAPAELARLEQADLGAITRLVLAAGRKLGG